MYNQTLLSNIPEELQKIINFHSNNLATIRYPYIDYNSEKIFITSPIEVTDKNTHQKGIAGTIMYQHENQYLPFLLESPKLKCYTGICVEKYQETKHIEPESSNEFNYYDWLRYLNDKGHPTGMSRMMCTFSPVDEGYILFRKILLDVYVACLKWMESHRLSKGIPPNNEDIQMINRCEHFSDNLRCPITFRSEIREEQINCKSRKYLMKKTIYPDKPQALDLSVKNITSLDLSTELNGIELSGVISPVLITPNEAKSFIRLEMNDISVDENAQCSLEEEIYGTYLTDDFHVVSGGFDAELCNFWSQTFNPQ